jgi:hypothetical protein
LFAIHITHRNDPNLVQRFSLEKGSLRGGKKQHPRNVSNMSKDIRRIRNIKEQRFTVKTPIIRQFSAGIFTNMKLRRPSCIFSKTLDDQLYAEPMVQNPPVREPWPHF